MNPALYLVTDPDLTRDRGLTATVVEAVRGGVSVVQVRDKAGDDDALVRAVTELREAGIGVPVLVDDSVTAAAHADGVHLGQTDEDPVVAREALGTDAVIGLSTSNPQQVRRAAALPVGTLDYLAVGPVWATGTKPDAANPIGPERVASLTALTDLPVVAIGGISAGPRVRALRGRGLAGICVVSAICGAADPAAAAAGLLADWQDRA